MMEFLSPTIDPPSVFDIKPVYVVRGNIAAKPVSLRMPFRLVPRVSSALIHAVSIRNSVNMHSFKLPRCSVVKSVVGACSSTVTFALTLLMPFAVHCQFVDVLHRF